MKKRINTTWEVWTYDVWGNDQDGYEVNDRSCIAREWPCELIVQTANEGTNREFEFASLSDADIRSALGLSNIRLDTYGDDMTVYVNRERDSYPIGEMFCTSHKSLSPIQVKA